MTFEREFADKTFLEALSPVELRTTSEIAKIMGYSNRLVERRLNVLVEAGFVEKKEIKASGRFGFKYYWKLAEAKE
jgi:predicted transcriptional regulator